MFVTELEPLFKQLTQHPVSFLGGFFSGMLRLNLSDEPVKSWLEQHLGSTPILLQRTESKMVKPVALSQFQLTNILPHR
jgi:hypothetical protein